MPQMTTEMLNERSDSIDELSPLEIVELINSEDALVATAVGREKQKIAQAVELIADRLRAGGRLFYIGAGTSGRLGVLDAAECPPTFSTPPELVVGIIAGGKQALTHAIEGAEDDHQQAEHDLLAAGFASSDVLVGIASSGTTPYVVGGLEFAKRIEAATVGLTCNAESPIHAAADLTIAPIVGPEVISGSTRLKAGTATKMVLNMLTTGAMVLLGKTYGNLMVDLRATNQKLKKRSVRIVRQVTGVDEEQALATLRQCDGEVKTSIVALKLGIDAQLARQRLQRAQGRLRAALRGE